MEQKPVISQYTLYEILVINTYPQLRLGLRYHTGTAI